MEIEPSGKNNTTRKTIQEVIFELSAEIANVKITDENDTPTEANKKAEYALNALEAMLMDPTSYDDFRRMQILRAVREVGVDKEKIKRIEKLLAMLEPATEPHSKKDKSKPISIEAALNIPSEGDMEVRGIGRGQGRSHGYQYHVRKNGRWNQVDGTRAMNPADCPEKPTKGPLDEGLPHGQGVPGLQHGQGASEEPPEGSQEGQDPHEPGYDPLQQADAVREQGTNPIHEQGTDPIRHRPPRTSGPQGGTSQETRGLTSWASQVSLLSVDNDQPKVLYSEAARDFNRPRNVVKGQSKKAIGKGKTPESTPVEQRNRYEPLADNSDMETDESLTSMEKAEITPASRQNDRKLKRHNLAGVRRKTRVNELKNKNGKPTPDKRDNKTPKAKMPNKANLSKAKQALISKLFSRPLEPEKSKPAAHAMSPTPPPPRRAHPSRPSSPPTATRPRSPSTSSSRPSSRRSSTALPTARWRAGWARSP